VKTTRTFRYLTIAAAAALSLTLASCTGSDETGDDSTSADETTAAEQTDDAEQTGDAETTADEGDGDDSASGGAECLIGTWAMDADAMKEQVLAQLGGEGEITVDGSSGIQFEADQLTTTVDYTSTYSVDVEGSVMEGTTVSDGAITVGYTADDSTITYGDVVSADGAVTIDMAGSEQEISLADSAAAMTGQSMDYTCTDTQLTLASDMGETSLEQTFTRS